MIDDVVIADLNRLGLHRNEAKVYRTLVRIGRSTARRVSDESGVPRSKVYDTLSALEKRGMIHRIHGTSPVQFMAHSPSFAIPLLLEKIEAAGRSAQLILERIEREREIQADEQIIVLEGEEQIKVAMRREVSLAKREVIIVTYDERVLFMLRPALAKAKAQNVEIKLITMGISREVSDEFRHYLTIQDLHGLSSKVLIDRMKKILNDERLDMVGWDPNQISIVVIDNNQSFAIFKATPQGRHPWALHVRNPLIVIFQVQVMTALMESIQNLIESSVVG